jgi:hypothetical protein
MFINIEKIVIFVAMDLQERLKTLKTNEFYKIVLEKTVSKQWYNDKEMCLYISKMILIILEKYYVS